jgi:hypothetical protein
MGNLDIATDNAMTNIVSIHFTYVTPTTSKGSANSTYTILNDIVNGKYKTVMANGKENAAKVRIDSAIGLNEFYSSRNGAEELVSAKRNEGGFIHIVDMLNENENERNTFKVDMVITSVNRTEANPDTNTEEKVTVHGCVFDFRNAILPVDFIATNPGAMDYYESLDASPKHPVFTRLWGRQISQTVIKTYTEESAWGEDSVRTVTSSRKEWLITGGAKETYSYGSEANDSPEDFDLTAKELVKAMSDRETYLATVKSRQEEYQASRNTPAPAAAASDNTGFNF